MSSANSPAPPDGAEDAFARRRSPRLAARTLSTGPHDASSTVLATTGTVARRNLLDPELPARHGDAPPPRSRHSAPPRPRPRVPRAADDGDYDDAEEEENANNDAHRANVGAAAGRRASATSTNGGGRQPKRTGSGPRFSIPEMEAMLNSITHFLPMGPEEWESVADMHGLEFPSTNREAQSLRRKFQALYNVRIPTGDPTMPAHVRRAKRIRYLIEERADASNLTGNDVDLGFPPADDDEEQEENDQEELEPQTRTTGPTVEENQEPDNTQRILLFTNEQPATEPNNNNSTTARAPMSAQ